MEEYAVLMARGPMGACQAKFRGLIQVVHPDFISIGEGEDGLVVVHTEKGLAILDIFNITAIELAHGNDVGSQRQ